MQVRLRERIIRADGIHVRPACINNAVRDVQDLDVARCPDGTGDGSDHQQLQLRVDGPFRATVTTTNANR